MVFHSDAVIQRVSPTGSNTINEIYGQPTLWRTTPPRVGEASLRLDLASIFQGKRVLLTGAGTSAHAATAVAAAWPQAIAVPTTDLLVDPERNSFGVDVVISLARSGDSPESVAVVESIRSLHPQIYQLAITCNEEGALAQCGLDGLIALDPRTNDRSLVMTSSFSNLVLAGLCLAKPVEAASSVEEVSLRAEALLPAMDEQCSRLAGRAAGSNCDVVVISIDWLGARGCLEGARNDGRPLPGARRKLSWIAPRSNVFHPVRHRGVVPALERSGPQTL